MDEDKRTLIIARMKVSSNRSGIDKAINKIPESLINDASLNYERSKWRRIKKSKNYALPLIKEINIPVQGGLDPKILLTDKENLKKQTLKYLEIFKDHPYIFNLGHGVLPETDPNMFEYMVNTVKNYQ